MPQHRLIFWTGAILLPLAVLAALSEPAGFAGGVGLAALVILAGGDALRSRRLLRDIRVEWPRTARLTRDRPGHFELHVRNSAGAPLRLRLGLAFPPELRPEHEDLTVQLPEGDVGCRLQWPCTPLKRGRYLLDRCYLETDSLLGFWAIRSSVPVLSFSKPPAPAEIRVYPNLWEDRKTTAALFLRRDTYGVHAHRQIGKGREFEKLRDYIPGDGFDEIHWKATAKRGVPVTKVFQVERTQEVYLVLDASRLSSRLTPRNSGQAVSPPAANPSDSSDTSDPSGIAATTVLERFITAGLLLGLAAQKMGDQFGLAVFGDRVREFIRARHGKQHFAACRDVLFTVQPEDVTPDFTDIASFIRLRLRKRALLIVLTNLDDPLLAEQFVRSMDLIRRQHLVIVGTLNPPGAQPLFQDEDVAGTDDLYRKLGGHFAWHNLRELEKVLQRRGIGFHRMHNENLSARLISAYLDVKRRQIL